jgi:hypothetical protein
VSADLFHLLPSEYCNSVADDGLLAWLSMAWRVLGCRLDDVWSQHVARDCATIVGRRSCACAWCLCVGPRVCHRALALVVPRYAIKPRKIAEAACVSGLRAASNCVGAARLVRPRAHGRHACKRHTYADTYIHKDTQTHTRTHTQGQTHKDKHTKTHRRTLAHTNTHKHKHTRIHTHTRAHTHIHTRMHAHARTYARTCRTCRQTHTTASAVNVTTTHTQVPEPVPQRSDGQESAARAERHCCRAAGELLSCESPSSSPSSL